MLTPWFMAAWGAPNDVASARRIAPGHGIGGAGRLRGGRANACRHAGQQHQRSVFSERSSAGGCVLWPGGFPQRANRRPHRVAGRAVAGRAANHVAAGQSYR